MPRVLISASFPEQDLARQTPSGNGRWGEFEFLFEPDGKAVDAWVVYDNLQHSLTQSCPPCNTLLITGEPPSLRTYRPKFTSQFSHVCTSHPSIRHPHVIRCSESQPWHYGIRAGKAHGKRLSFDDLLQLQRPNKSKLLSVICSSKKTTTDHRRRLDFVHFLQAKLGSSLDVYGSGIAPVDDKSDAIYPYKYHIVLENDHSDHFMTEKLPDAFLGWSYPIYFGGPEAAHNFPQGSYTAIDIYQPEVALQRIEETIARNAFENSLQQLSDARQIVLNELNLFEVLTRFWQRHLSNENPAPVTLYPKSHSARLVLGQLRRRITR